MESHVRMKHSTVRVAVRETKNDNKWIILSVCVLFLLTPSTLSWLNVAELHQQGVVRARNSDECHHKLPSA